MAAEFVVASANYSRQSPGAFIVSHVRRYPLLIVFLLIGAITNAALAGILFYYFGNIYDGILAYQAGEITRSAVMLIIVDSVWWVIFSQVIRAVLQFCRNFSAEIYGQRIERDVRDELYSNLLGKSMDFHARQPIGEIMARVTNDVRELNLLMNPGVNLIVGSGMFLLMPLFFTPLISWQLTLTPLAFALAYSWAQQHYLESLQPVAQEVRRSFGEMNGTLAEVLEGLEIVKGAAQEPREIARFNRQIEAVRQQYVRQGDVEAVYLPLFMFGLSLVIGLAHSLYLANLNLISNGDVVRFMGYLSLFGFPVFVSQTAFSQLASGFASARRILNTINTETKLDQNISGRDEPLTGALELENVTFRYNLDGKPTVNKVSFRVEPGQTVAIVGQTGSGKSTLTKLINRTYDVSEGRVLLDGVDVRDWNLASLRSQISIIEQDIFLFSRTIAENIAFGRENATQAEIEHAAKMAQAHDFILEFPEGYQTVIGQRGVTLSGGQRQRLAIARAFLTDPKILILDDSTSAIDSATEDRIQKAIWAAAQGRTTLLVTHRLSQIRWADHIIVIKNGEVVAQGKHDDLLESSQAYRRIFARYESRETAAEGEVR
ncbi:MAG: ABC transporter ATP-binding protein [Phototrophicaceae bacterium]